MEIRPAKLNDLDELVAAVEADSHTVIRPTHVAIRNGEFIGYASIAAVPLVLFYMHSRKASRVNTFKMERFCEDACRKAGAPMVCAPCAVESPIHPFMQKLGFSSFGRMDMFMKALQ